MIKSYETFRVFSVSTMASDHDGRSDSGLEAFESESSIERPSSDTAEAPPSKGSINHPHKCGPPCKYAGKASGCEDGANCTHCHLCQWYRSPQRSRTSAMTCARCPTGSVAMRKAVEPAKAAKAQEKQRQRARSRRCLSATEEDVAAICSGYMSPEEEFWY